MRCGGASATQVPSWRSQCPDVHSPSEPQNGRQNPALPLLSGSQPEDGTVLHVTELLRPLGSHAGMHNARFASDPFDLLAVTQTALLNAVHRSTPSVQSATQSPLGGPPPSHALPVGKRQNELVGQLLSLLQAAPRTGAGCAMLLACESVVRHWHSLQPSR